MKAIVEKIPEYHLTLSVEELELVTGALKFELTAEYGQSWETDGKNEQDDRYSLYEQLSSLAMK